MRELFFHLERDYVLEEFGVVLEVEISKRRNPKNSKTGTFYLFRTFIP